MTITPVYTALLAMLFVVLSVRTLRLRHRLQVAIGDGNQKVLARAARAHANFAEYVPIAILLIFFLEREIGSVIWIHVLCILLLVGRLSHAYGVSQVNENFKFRVFGMALTFTAIISAGLRLLIAYL